MKRIIFRIIFQIIFRIICCKLCAASKRRVAAIGRPIAGASRPPPLGPGDGMPRRMPGADLRDAGGSARVGLREGVVGVEGVEGVEGGS